MDCQASINYLKSTDSSLWDFNTVVNIIKATNDCSNDKAFAALNTILKKDFDSEQNSFFVTNWKSLVRTFDQKREDPKREKIQRQTIQQQTIQSQTNIDTVNTLNNTNTNIIQRKRRMNDQEDATSGRRRKTFSQIFDESSESSDAEANFRTAQNTPYHFNAALTQEVDNILKSLSATNEETIYAKVEGCKPLAKTYMDRQILKMVLELLEFLPKYPQPNVNEENLRVKYLDPAMKYFLNNKSLGIALTYPESSPDERKLRTDTIKRPDAIASFYQQVEISHHGAFFEIKNESYKNRKRILMVDLLKLVYYGKDALDAGVKTPILAQVIGFDVTFYLMKLQAKGVYIMFEVCHVKLPLTTFEIGVYLRAMDEVQKLANILAANKTKEPMIVVNEKRMASYGTPRVERMVEELTYKHSTSFFF
ncbi:hypothetical protein MBANPS3_012404 [Mucor bainieri]